MKSLAEIQVEEVDFKTRQDKSYEHGGGSWFIERKEGADSLQEIKLSAEKEREERLLIEEQHIIEAQIQKDVALQREKKQEGVAKNRSSRRKNKIGPDGHSNGSTKGTPANEQKTQDGDKKVGISGNSKPGGCRSKNRNGSKAGKSGPKGVPSNQKGKNVQTKGRPGNKCGSSGTKEEAKQGVPPASKLEAALA
jgi:hypothetical protein